MHLVGDLNRLGRSDLADSDRADGREPVAERDRTDQTRQVMLVANRAEQIVRPSSRFDASGSSGQCGSALFAVRFARGLGQARAAARAEVRPRPLL